MNTPLSNTTNRSFVLTLGLFLVVCSCKESPPEASPPPDQAVRASGDGSRIPLQESLNTPESRATTPSVNKVNEPILLPSDRSLSQLQDNIRVTFETPMVGLEKLNRKGLPSPIIFDPTVEFAWEWLSPREGWIILNPTYKIRHTAKLRPGLKDQAGNPVRSENWGIELVDEKFALSHVSYLNFGWSSEDGLEGRNPESNLPSMPRIRLEFTRDVDPQEARKIIFFRDVKNRKNYPVEVNLEARQKLAPQGWILIEPLEELPGDCSFNLVIERLSEPGGKRMPYMTTIPIGKTYVPTIKEIEGFHRSWEETHIVINGSQSFTPDRGNADLIKVTPTPTNLRIISDGSIRIYGDFDTQAAYQVEITKGLLSESGYRTTQSYRRRIEFPELGSIVIFTESFIFRRPVDEIIEYTAYHANTGPLRWNIAKIPRSKLAGVRKAMLDEKLLIQEFNLPVVASGVLPASSKNRAEPRKIKWQPGDRNPGLYLLEAVGDSKNGLQAGNRAIISRGDWFVNRMDSESGTRIRVVSMTDGTPVQGVPVELWDADKPIAQPKLTDKFGEVSFEERLDELTYRTLEYPHMGGAIIVGPHGKETMQFASISSFVSGEKAAQPHDRRPSEKTQFAVISDRSVYKPGETIRFKGYARTSTPDGPEIPSGQAFKGVIADANGPVFEFEGVVSETGSFEEEWTIPSEQFGQHTITIGENMHDFKVAEFRLPPFSIVTVAKSGVLVDDTATLDVSSRYHHGAVNADAKVRWKAEWVIDDWRSEEWFAVDLQKGLESAERHALILQDEHSPDSTSKGMSNSILRELNRSGWTTAKQDAGVLITKTVTGETTMDDDGYVHIECPQPFPEEECHGRAKVYWVVDVLSKDTDQAARGGSVSKVQFVDHILGVNMERSNSLEISVQVGSFDATDRRSAGQKVRIEVFPSEIKTVKEALNDNIHRYRNFPVFGEPIWEGVVTTPAIQPIPVTKGGKYVVRVTSPDNPRIPQVSDAVWMDHDDDASIEILNEHALFVETDKDHYKAGEEAVVEVRSPIKGTAVVTVQVQDRILHRQIETVDGKIQRLKLPILPSFSPNAFVCVHVYMPGSDKQMAAERFGYKEINVARPDHLLTVIPSVPASARPGSIVSGKVTVSNEGLPVEGSEVLVFAVDESLLELGRWKLPDLKEAFYPRRQWETVTFAAMGKRWSPTRPDSLASEEQKGFTIGDGNFGPSFSNKGLRSNFKPLAYWKADHVTDSKGETSFSFELPDALTSYRVVAVANKGARQSGDGKAVITVNKELQIEPILPSLLRAGDEVTFVCAIRQTYADYDELEVRVRVGESLTMQESNRKLIKTTKGKYHLVTFSAKASGDLSHARVSFEARSTSKSDEHYDGMVESIPVYPNTIERREVIYKAFKAGQQIDIAKVIADRWQGSKGTCDVMLSGSDFLAKLAGLPDTIDPGTSTEKLTSSILAAALLADSYEYLPRRPGEAERLRKETQRALERLSSATSSGQGITSWMRAAESHEERNNYATIQAAWAIRSSEQRGFHVPPLMAQKASDWLKKIISKDNNFRKCTWDDRCFALFVWTRTQKLHEKEDFTAEAERLYNERKITWGNGIPTLEGQAWLAMALQQLGTLAIQRQTLLSELRQPPKGTPFDPSSYRTATRSNAIAILAICESSGVNWSPAKWKDVLRMFRQLTDTSVDLTSQENLWFLLALNALNEARIPGEMANRPLSPKPHAKSENEVSVGWFDVPLAEARNTFSQPLTPGLPGVYLVRATYPMLAETSPQDPDFQLKRLVRNLTNKERIGSSEAPWKTGDQLLITYELSSDSEHSHLRLEDAVPGCIEIVNPLLPPVVELFHLPEDNESNTMTLTSVEFRQAKSMFFFKEADQGRNVYSVIARVNIPGTFTWPRSQVNPMYDHRYFGFSQPQTVHAVR